MKIIVFANIHISSVTVIHNKQYKAIYHIDGLTLAIIIVFEFPPRESCIMHKVKSTVKVWRNSDKTVKLPYCLPEVKMSALNLYKEYALVSHWPHPQVPL